ncbi:hypothetical protein N7465_004325 [Penicillium sp. CMV-2018d]|nr:hypothetical protein N7465_004325 [Penicillium sp. CMV-2018d]
MDFSEEAVRDRTVISEARLQRNYAVSKLVERIATVIGRPDTSARWGTTVPILILTQTVDVTFLPGFRSAGGRYKDSVGILEGWDGKPSLREVARGWSHGTVYVLDTNAFCDERIRDWQLYVALRRMG